MICRPCLAQLWKNNFPLFSFVGSAWPVRVRNFRVWGRTGVSVGRSVFFNRCVNWRRLRFHDRNAPRLNAGLKWTEHKWPGVGKKTTKPVWFAKKYVKTKNFFSVWLEKVANQKLFLGLAQKFCEPKIFFRFGLEMSQPKNAFAV